MGRGRGPRGPRVIALLLGLALAGEPEWGPWDDHWAPVGEVEAHTTRPARRGGTFETLYRWYRGLPDKGVAGCPYYPTCSGYFILNVRAHGPVLAGLYTWDRFMREYPFMETADHYPLVTPHGTPRLYDPIPVRLSRDERRRRRERERERADHR
ncbi:MAG: membrane protein insertion efficiency factor YidD [Deltaproteobacteria bacterium]|nr:MAG: membrane protein insertion efficiency factor YidD [Deltaproteobacteria bacterium]